MELKVTGNLTQLKNDYCEFIKQYKNDDKLYNVVLTYAEPTRLHQSNHLKDDVVSNIHIVKRLFFTDGRIANCMHQPELEATNAYYVPKKKRSGGFNLDLYGLQKLEIVPTAQKDYSKQWKAISNSMRKYNINLDVAQAIEDGIAGKTKCDSEFCKRDKQEATHTHFAQNYWDMKKDKPRLMSFADVVNRFGEKTIDRLKELASKSNYGDYKVYHDNINGVKRDRSIEFQVDADGKMRFTSASEYAGCGNGSYYMMYSPTMAFYCEDD